MLRDMRSDEFLGEFVPYKLAVLMTKNHNFTRKIPALKQTKNRIANNFSNQSKSINAFLNTYSTGRLRPSSTRNGADARVGRCLQSWLKGEPRHHHGHAHVFVASSH